MLVIPDLYAPMGLSHLLNPPSSAGPANAQQQEMRTQVLLSMGQDCPSEEEAGELLDQRVHVLTSTQELRHLTRNFVKLEGDYLREESPICLSVGMCPRHIGRFGRKYNKAFAGGPLFGAYLMDRIHKRIQVFLHYCNTTAIEGVELGTLEEFGGLQKKL